MAFKERNRQPNFSRLQSVLNEAKALQVQNNPLYQVVSQLISRTQVARDLIIEDIKAGDSHIINIIGASFLTIQDETTLFPASRQLLAGSGVTFDDDTPAQRTITVIDSFLLMGG